MGSFRFTPAVLILVAVACGGNEIVPPPPPSPPPPPPVTVALGRMTAGFHDTIATASPAPVTLSVTGLGGELTGLAVGTIAWGPGPTGWLTASLAASTTPTTLTLTPSSTALAAGTYTATVPVTAANATNSPQSVTVTFQLSAVPAGGALIGVAGNIATCAHDRDSQTAALLDDVATVFTLGDNVFPRGSLGYYETCYEQSWGRHKARTYAVLGNHDYESGTSGGAFDYFGDRAGPRGQGYYSVEIGDWHIIVLNDNPDASAYGAGSAQVTWLHDDLARNTRRCTMALWHQPRFLSSNTSGFTVSPNREALWNELYSAGADVVVNGHQHHYERMAPMAPDGSRDLGSGIRQFNVGTGGESTHLPTVAIHQYSEVRAISFGVLKLHLRPDGYDWQFVSLPGDGFTDTGSGTCH